MSLPDFGDDIDQMTAYCTYCPKMCRFSCPTAGAEGRETVTPWGMMRLLEMAKDGSVALSDEVADTFYHCTGCRRCQTFCNHDNDVPQALWKARKWAVDSGVMPEAFQSLHKRFEQSDSPYGAPTEELDETPFDAAGTVGYWPDCSTVAHRPHLIGPIGRLMARITGEKIRLIRSDDFDHPPCCGFPLTGAGLEDAQSCRDDRWPSLKGLDAVWTDCPALAAWNRPDSSWSMEKRDGDPDMDHLFVLLAGRLGELPPPDEPLSASDTLLHQSCYVARQLDANDAVDEIIAHITDCPPQKLAYEGDESPCCGGRCHYRILEPEASDDAARTVLGSLERHDGADKMVTTSSMCRQAMNEAGDTELVTSVLEMVCRAYGVMETT